ncbi:Pectinesterase inhibitor domain containing protein [Parasponia andersonii]|uniref:Pectinesterase n=1 Tax=Parasponia andersonii TaxID=3476 RepID=A0A2P5B1H4_PARAD|nr:Pectinesterase inhibitor domain containing protein [Parasponia andersonii]
MATFNQLFMLIILFFSFSFASPLLSSPTTTTPPKNNTAHYSETICNTTPYPFECISNLPRHQSGTVRDFCRFFLQKSLSTTKHFLSLLDSYLKRQHPGSRSTLPEPNIRALQDCHLLAELSLDTLSKTYQTIDFTNTLNSFETEEFQTLLSAVLTNTQTCLEGLEEAINSPSIVKNVVSFPLTIGIKLYSISLALFKRGWVDDVNYGKREYTYNNRAAAVIGGGRKLLQAGLGGVVVSDVVVVNRNGTGNFSSISDAVAAAPNNTAISNTSSYYVIYVVGGVYEEYVSIPRNKQNLMLIGSGINQTVITGNRSVVDGWTTFNSATFAVVGQGFVAINITFRNTAGAIKHQAVAVRNGADLSAFYSCSFEGYQDTLYAHSLRQFYRDCDIYGTIDFIFGNAAVVFQNCNIYPRLPLLNQFNAITAQGRTDPNQNTGTSIQNCIIRAAQDLVMANYTNGTTRTFLGRPWKEYSRTVFMQSYMDSLIDPAGWTEWSGNFSLTTLYYAEFNNSGPGSNTSNRVTWPGFHVISSSLDVANFTLSSFILGDSWLPTTGVPYTNGLL